jgi:hypothetical protein
VFLYITSQMVYSRMICKFFTAVVSSYESLVSGYLKCGKCIQNLSDSPQKRLVNVVGFIEFFF